MRRPVLLAALAAALALPAAADAHPLGNFSLNHQARVSVSADRVDVTYLLDQAEIPTFQERGRPREAVLARKRAEVLRRLALTVGGRRVALAPGAERIAFPAGQGGLRTTRVELRLSAAVATTGRTVRLRDATFPGRAGWKAIVAVPGRGTAVRSSVPAEDPTARLTRYPQDLLGDPPDQREATFAVRAGDGTVTAPRADGSGMATRRGEGFAGVLDGAGGMSLLLLLAACGWGAVHALSPGHGKAMVAAYLVGTRGTARHAVALGLTVTVTHTIGVFALGVVTLGLSAWIVPEDLYPWLNLTGRRARRGRRRERPAHPPARAARAPPSPPPSRADHLARPRRDGRCGRARPVPVGARGAARRDRPAPGRARAPADRRLQRRARRDADRARARRRRLRAGARAARRPRPDRRPPCPRCRRSRSSPSAAR